MTNLEMADRILHDISRPSLKLIITERPWRTVSSHATKPKFYRVAGTSSPGPSVDLPRSALYKQIRKPLTIDVTIIKTILARVVELTQVFCPACRSTLIATRFWVVMICPIIKCLTVLRVFFYFVWFVFIHHNFQFYFELCTYCDILDIYLS